jgi:hypothetical protein
MSPKAFLMNKIFVVIFLLFSGTLVAQKDSSFTAMSPLVFNISPLFSSKHFGSQIGLSQFLIQKEIHRKSLKIIKKERWISLDLGFYTQPELHNSLFLTGSYTMKRINTHGYYRQFRPFLGISQTFLNEESYSVNANNEVILNGLIGNLYLTGGFGLDIGKVFSVQKSKLVRDVRIGVLVQTYYPNFGFIALRPAYQIGISADLPTFLRKYKKKIIYAK